MNYKGNAARSDKIPPPVAKAIKQPKLVCKFLIERMGYKLIVDPLIFHFKNGSISQYYIKFHLRDKKKEAILTTFRSY